MLLSRRKWMALVVAVVMIMFAFNVLFIVDLTYNHSLSHQLRDGWERGPGEVEEKAKIASPRPPPLSLQLHSSKERVELMVKGAQVYASHEGQRGIHVIVLNQANGEVMASRVFDTYGGLEDALIDFLNAVSDDRILCLAIQDEGTLSLKEAGRSSLKALGSKIADGLSWRDTWAFVAVKGGGVKGEDVGKSVDVSQWGPPTTLRVSVSLTDTPLQCDWPHSPETVRRSAFCSRYEGYGSLCHCSHPLPLHFYPPPLTSNSVSELPVAIIASNRPLYLFRMLRGLLSTAGANVSQVTVFIDGFFQEPMDVAALFKIRAIQHEPKSQKNGRISQHYKASLSETFDLYPNAKYMIIIEEDLDVAPDFFSYFSQTVRLLDEDDSLYCVSAWNDQGYDHSCQDPAALYRVETMPGLGWVLRRALFKEELEPQWPGPDKLWDWDMWMRMDAIRKGRECVIPDVSRTYHFGASGLNMNPYFQEHYFKKHTLNRVSDVHLSDVDSIKKENYEVVIHNQLRNAKLLDHSNDPCKDDFIPDTTGLTYIVFIVMENAKDYDHWIKLATCFHLWDLDARGFHKGLWRFWMKGNHILVVGHPYSAYSSYMPPSVTPLRLAKPKR